MGQIWWCHSSSDFVVGKFNRRVMGKDAFVRGVEGLYFTVWCKLSN